MYGYIMGVITIRIYPYPAIGGKSNKETMVSVHCTILLEHVIKLKASYFDTDLVSQMKLTTLPPIHCFAVS